MSCFKTVCYRLDKINTEIEQVAVFVDLQQCCIENVPAKVYEEEMATLNVILKDTKGQPICSAANILTTGVTTTANNEVASSVKELEDGRYSVSFTPVAPVEHVVSVQINGIDVSKSPMRILCCQVEYTDSSDSLVDISPPVSIFSTWNQPGNSFNSGELSISTARCDERMNVVNVPPIFDSDVSFSDDDELIDPPTMNIRPLSIPLFSQNNPAVTQPHQTQLSFIGNEKSIPWGKDDDVINPPTMGIRPPPITVFPQNNPAVTQPHQILQPSFIGNKTSIPWEKKGPKHIRSKK